MIRAGVFSLVALTLSHAGAQSLPWYMQETAMSADGRLTFLNKPWWPRAKALAEGQSFTLDLNKDGRPDTLIRRQDGNIIEIIDDTGKAPDIAANTFNSAWVVSLNGTGLVDRMVVYIDNDGDGKADETDFRHYRDGYLRYSWFSENHDKDGAPVFMMRNWSYVGGGDFRNKFRGNVDIYLNKYDPKTRAWVPLSECPFTFWDLNNDGHSDIVLRVSAAPLNSNSGSDPDYANHYDYMWAPEATPLSETGNMNVRFSYNIDPEPRHEPVDKPHFTFGFNLVGSQPYKYPGMEYTNSRRRPPQTVVRLPRTAGVDMALHYPATQTGFSWDEARTVFRWEGQFWIFEREYMPNTGGPVMRWNMRREYSAEPVVRTKAVLLGSRQALSPSGCARRVDGGWPSGQRQQGPRVPILRFRWRRIPGQDRSAARFEPFACARQLHTQASYTRGYARPCRDAEGIQHENSSGSHLPKRDLHIRGPDARAC